MVYILVTSPIRLFDEHNKGLDYFNGGMKMNGELKELVGLVGNDVKLEEWLKARKKFLKSLVFNGRLIDVDALFEDIDEALKELRK